jgi:hypothetical protein
MKSMQEEEPNQVSGFLLLTVRSRLPPFLISSVSGTPDLFTSS